MLEFDIIHALFTTLEMTLLCATTLSLHNTNNTHNTQNTQKHYHNEHIPNEPDLNDTNTRLEHPLSRYYET